MELVSEYYRPSSVLNGMSLSEIIVKKEYIAYSYANENEIELASFTWFREMSPDVARNDLYGRGAISERELEYKGASYVFLEWADPDTSKSAGYSIHWVVDDNAYQASIPTGYTDEEMLEFCQFNTIKVK